MENAYHMCGKVKSLTSSSATLLGISDWIRDVEYKARGQVGERDRTPNV